MSGLSFAPKQQNRPVLRDYDSVEKKIQAGAMVKLKKSPDEVAEQALEPLLIELSPQEKANLVKLQLNSLDRQGRQPGPSQIIEKLINADAVSDSDAPYPA